MGPVQPLFALALCLIASPLWAAWPDGVLNYCGFEGAWDEAGWRDLGWMQGGTEGMAFDRQVKRWGKAALRVEGAEGQTKAALNLPGVAIEPGRKYILRALVRTEGVIGKAGLRLQPHAEGEPLAFMDLGDAAFLSGSHDWMWLEVKVPPFPTNAVRMYPYIWMEGPGTAWFDEFSLAYEGVVVPAGGQREIPESEYGGVRFEDGALPANLLANPGFEEGLTGWFTEIGRPRIDETAAAEGSRSLCYDGYPRCSYTTVAVHVRIDPRRAYRLSLKQKTALTAGLSCVRVLAFWQDGSGFGWWHSQDYTCEFLHGEGTRDWQEMSVVWRRFPPETDYLNIYLELADAAGSVWFDDVRLTPLTLAETREVRGQ